MGRTMLIVVLLMGTIYAGIVCGLQHRMLDLPEIVTRNIITKQAENVSDYALRLAIRDGNYLRSTLMAETEPNSMAFVYTPDPEYRIQNSKIDRIEYVFQGTTGSGNDLKKRFLATSYVTSELMGHQVTHQAKVAFELFAVTAFDGNIYHNSYTMDGKPWHRDMLYDTSGNNYHAYRVHSNLNSGDNGAKGNYAIFGKRGQGRYPDGTGPDDVGRPPGGGAHVGGDLRPTYLYFDDDTKPVQVEQTCTLSAWVRLANDAGDEMVLLWLPPDIEDPDYEGIYKDTDDPVEIKAFNQRPTAAIKYIKPNIVFIANTVKGEELRITHPFCLTHGFDKLDDAIWHHFYLTYDNGILKGYVDGDLVGTETAENYPVELIVNKGFYIGREHPASGWAHNIKGHLDEVGFSPYVLSTNLDDLSHYYTSIATPAKILYFRD